MKNIAIFASGSGTNFEALVQAVEENKINGKVVLMVCDKKNAYVVERAKNHNIPAFIFSAKDYKSKEEYEQVIVNKLDECKVDLVCLAGYMRICGNVLLKNYHKSFESKLDINSKIYAGSLDYYDFLSKHDHFCPLLR